MYSRKGRHDRAAAVMVTVAGNKKSPGMLASIRTVLQVFRKESRKGSLRFRNLGSNRQLTVGQLNYLGGGTVHGRGGRYRLAAKRKNRQVFRIRTVSS